MDNFCEAVRDADTTGKLRIVISFTWRLRHVLDDLIVKVPLDVAIRIVGVTPKLSELHHQSGSRQREIEAWLSFEPNAKWLAIDDKSGLFDEACPNLFHIPYSDATLEADMRAAMQPLSPELNSAFRDRKRLNRSIGLTGHYAKKLAKRLERFMGEK
jgi:hypothetical protein